MAAAPEVKRDLPPPDVAHTAGVCKKALAFMEEHKIAAIPEHYALFFRYAEGNDPLLQKEIETLIATQVPFVSHVLKNLHHSFIVSNQNQQLITEMTNGAQMVMEEVCKFVGDMGAATQNYNQSMDGFIQKIDVNVQDSTMQQVLKNLVMATVQMRQEGETLNSRLNESKLEVETLRRNLTQITQESQRDFLTGVYNRKALDALIADQLKNTKDIGQPISLLMIDVDHFKQFNDKYGHLLGDEVLKIVARALTFCVRGKDIVARYGGEEFCVLLPGTPLSGATRVAETIRTTIATRDLKRKDTGESYGVLTVSIGAAEFRHHSDTGESLVKRADEALYRAKRAGRNRVMQDGH